MYTQGLALRICLQYTIVPMWDTNSKTNNWNYCFYILENWGGWINLSVKNPLIRLKGEEVKKSFLSGLSLSPSAYCLVNRLTCCQRSLCECALAEGQSDPPACLSQGGKWRPWYAISGRNVQTVWLLRKAWLAVALPKTMPEELPVWPLARGTRSTRAGGYLSVYSLKPHAHRHFKNNIATPSHPLPQVLTTFSFELHR